MKKITTLIISLLMVVLTATAIGCGGKNSTSKITFDANGGVAILNSTEVSSITVASGSSFELPTATKEGYTFNYWQYNNQEFDKNSFDFKNDITLTAVYTANAYTVKFSGVSPAIADASVTFGSAYTLPEATKAGYVFGGWVNGTEAVELTGTWNIASDVTLTAVFVPIVSTIEYNLDGGAFATGVVPVNSATYDKPVQLFAPIKEGFIFKGWKVEGSDVLYNNSISWNFTTNITFIAVWEEDKVINLTLDAGDGNFGAVKTQSATLEKGANYNLTKFQPTSPAGHVFEGWYFGEEKVALEGAWNYSFGKNVTLTAKYVAIEVITFTLNLDGGSLLGGYPSSYEFYKGTNYNIANYVAEKSGYRFLGWYISTDSAQNVIATTGAWTAGNVTLVAKYELIDIRTITLDAGTGTLNGQSSYSFEQGKNYDFSATTVTAPQGFAFIGWYLGETKVETSGNSFNMGTQTAFTLVAKYKYVGNVTITLDVGDGTLEGENTITFANGSAYDLTNYVPNKEGYRFIGWLLNGTKINNVGNWNFGDASEYTLVAEYEYIDYRTVNLYAFDMVTEELTLIETKKIEQGTNYDFTSCVHPQGLTLYGSWYLGQTEIASQGVLNFGDEAVFNVVGAFYLAGEITINFNAGNGTINLGAGPVHEASYVLQNASEYSLVDATAPENYTFVGWYVDGDADETILNKVDFLVMPTLEPITLVAKYAYIVPLTITIEVGNGSIIEGEDNIVEIRYGDEYDFSQFILPPTSTNEYDPWRLDYFDYNGLKIAVEGVWNYSLGEVTEITITAEYINYSLDDNWHNPV